MINVTKCMRINAPVDKVYNFWSRMEDHVSSISSVESVERLDDHRSRWVVKVPMGLKMEFETNVTERLENERIQWTSHHTGGVTKGIRTEGEVRFVPAEEGRSTDAHLKFDYEMPGQVSEKIAETLKKIGYPDKQFEQGLEDIKNYLESQP